MYGHGAANCCPQIKGDIGVIRSLNDAKQCEQIDWTRINLGNGPED